MNEKKKLLHLNWVHIEQIIGCKETFTFQTFTNPGRTESCHVS